MRDFYFYTDMSTPDRPIGFFDSGIGGISIWKEVIQLLPNESCMYLADSKNAPYGMQSKEDIIQFSIKNREFYAYKPHMSYLNSFFHFLFFTIFFNLNACRFFSAKCTLKKIDTDNSLKLIYRFASKGTIE